MKMAFLVEDYRRSKFQCNCFFLWWVIWLQIWKNRVYSWWKEILADFWQNANVTLPVVYSAFPSLMGLSNFFQLYFSWHNFSLPRYPFVSKFFPDVDIFELFCNNITPTKLRTPSGKNPSYYVIIYSFWSNILIILRRWPKHLNLLHWISSMIVIIPSFLWSS